MAPIGRDSGIVNQFGGKLLLSLKKLSFWRNFR